MRNRQYYISFENFFKRLFQFLKDLPEEALPVELKYQPILEENGNHGFELKKSIDFGKLIELHFDQIMSWKEYAALSQHVILMSEYAEIWEDKEHFHLNSNYIPSVTQKLFARFNTSFSYIKQSADDFYRLIENCIYLDEWQYSSQFTIG